ncbi:hypothetical protein ACWD3I_25275 [Streptomyces sp. NPDC002817]|uniref:hypothetical protein n=1 Tax=Streptomyces sp. NPDC088357 TaxID=3154655 RepID=UPI0034472309
MRPFSVYVEFDTADASPDTYEALHDALADQHGAVGPSPNGNISVRLTVNADSVIEATTLGIEHAQAAALPHGITPDTVIGTEVITEAERDRRVLEEDEYDESSTVDERQGRDSQPAFIVYVEFDRADGSLNQYEALHCALAEQRGAVGPASNGNLSCRLTVEADSVVQAVALGIEYAQAAAITCDISPDAVIGTEVERG